MFESKHDLSISGTSKFTFETEQVCVFCHTPHRARQNIQNATAPELIIRTGTVYNTTNQYQEGTGTPSLLLWNRGLSNQTEFLPYTSSTLNVNIYEIRIYSLLCLSCHDGINALNVLVNNPSEVVDGQPPSLEPVEPGGPTRFKDVYTGDSTYGWGPNIGERVNPGDTLNLSNDHPISFDYPSDTTHPDVDAKSLRATVSGSGYVNHTSVRLFPNPTDPSKLNSMECSTCHDVHNEYADTPQYPFLVIPNKGSGLCLNCHVK
ncbi:MAG: hypothetical protein HY805_02360 [Nitrospirae bacterium]|nr:hypothetical protein [Nitrospirota bacterium]